MSDFFLICNYVLPIFILIGIGYLLKKLRIIDNNFVKASNLVVFRAALPALLFVQISNADLTQKINSQLVVFSYAATLASFGVVWIVGYFVCKNIDEIAVFIQGGFRGNYAIIGLALIESIFGKAALGKGSIVLAFTIPLYNVLAVYCLTMPKRRNSDSGVLIALKEIFTNPIILGIAAGVPFSLFKISLPPVFQTTVNYLANICLPLALVGLGGFISFKDLRKVKLVSIFASLFKIVIIPLAGTYIAYLIGFRSLELAVLFILFASPTAVASFVMADAMGTDSKMAAEILLLTTLGSLFTITTGLYIIKANHLF